ncbi:MAG TPA: glycosyltransferase family 4 protein [Ohtaekwangia sp.]|uniref:glycosyltransferase family 4 protein n=1 Tax=Ohtaekwangia sp. TaxID=2066019 RepID=UPI002F91DB0E
MNILFIGFSLRSNAGGIERYLSTILKQLKKRGFTIFVYVMHDADQDPDFIYLNNEVKKIKFFDRFLLGFRIGNHLRKKGIKIDLFFCGHILLFNRSELISRSIGVKYDLFVYGIDCWGNRFREPLHQMKSLRKVISISSFTTEQVRKQEFGGEIIYFPPLVENLPERIQHNISHDKIILLTVARLDPNEMYKGHDAVIKSLKSVQKHFSNFEYWIVGRGKDMDRLKTLANELDLENEVKFFGFVDDVKLAEIYEQADIFIMPSRVSLDPNKLEGEGFGIVFTEAALYEKALIGPDTGGSVDIIDHNINGLACDPTNTEQIATCILTLVNDPALRKRLGENARNKVLNQFTINQFDQYFNPILQ